MNLPILIAKARNAIICKDQYKIGWLVKQGHEWFWVVWGAAKDLDSAIRCAKLTIKEKGERAVYLSENPLLKTSDVQTEELELTEIKL